jgi:predicted peptidase
MNKQHPILLFVILALLAAAPFSNAQAQQLSESRLAQLLKRFPAADANGDGKLTLEEFKAARQKFRQSRQGNGRPAATAQTKLVFDPGWEKEKFPPHAVSLKTPDEIMAIYKKGEAGRTYVESGDAMSFPKPADGIMRIVGTGHSFTAPGYRTLPAITRAAGFEQPVCLHNGGGITGSARYKWEQENGIFEFDGKPLPKLLAAISNAEWEAMIWGPHGGDRPEFYTCWIDFCEQYNPGMKFFLTDLWPAPGQVRVVFNLKENPESEAFFTEAVYDQLSAHMNAGMADLVKTLRESTDEVYVIPTHAAMTEAAKRFIRGELPGVEGLYKVIGGKELSIWVDKIGHIGPGFDRLEGYVFYATLYGKSPELISEPIKFSKNPSFLSDDLDKIFREIAWKAVVEHPLSGVTDENKNGIGDHLETFPATAQNKNQPEPFVSAETIALYVPGEFKGVQYRLMKPIDFDPSKTYPLILSLHGGSGRGTHNIKNLLIWNEYLADEDLRRKHPAFVLAPQSNGRWLDNTSEVKLYPEPGSITIDDLPEGMRKFGARMIERIEEASRAPEPVYGVLDEVFELIDTKLSKQYKIDADRVYVLGHSMGGLGTFTAVYQHPDRFAAAIPSAGHFYPWLDAKRIQDVPLWIFHGKPDKVVDYIGSRHVFDRLNKLNANAKFTTLKGVGHGSKNSPAFKYTGDDPEKGYITEYASDRCDKTDHVWDWLFRQKR